MKCPNCMKYMVKWSRYRIDNHKFWTCITCGILYCSKHNDYNFFNQPANLIEAPKGWNKENE